MAFNSLPLELNEHIAKSLDTDREVCNFRLICLATNAAVETYRCGVWRHRFARRYDMPGKIGGRTVAMMYKIRTKLLRKSAKFVLGRDPREIRCMEILRDLILESYANLPVGRKPVRLSNNIREIERFVRRSGIFKKVFFYLEENSNINPLLQTLQLVLTHLELNISSGKANPHLGFEFSQSAVYCHPDDIPMLNADGTGQVSIKLLLHIANFFKHHLTQKDQGTLYELFSQLEPHEKPKAWNSKLVQGDGVQKLGKHWKGTYAYLHDLNDMDLIRHCEPGKEYFFTDSIDHHDGFQTLELDFTPQANRAPWPKVFESHLNAMPPPTLCNILDSSSSTPNKTKKRPHQATPQTPSHHPPPKRGIHYQPFSGSGADAEPFHCSGIAHPLPPQEDIPGWTRVSMMKYFDPLNSNNNNSALPPSYRVDDDAELNAGCWAYEGVVLPGGMIMLGRWWSPLDETMRCMGPFVFWNVDRD